MKMTQKFLLAAVASSLIASVTSYAVDYKTASNQNIYSSTQPPLKKSGILFGVQGGYGNTHWDNVPGISKEDGFTARAFLGYDFNRFFGAELGYIYLPKAKIDGSNIKNDAVDLFGKLYSPSYQGFKVYAKAGGAYLRSRASGEKNTHFGPAYGAGLSYEVTPSFLVDLSWTRYSGYGKLGDQYQPNPDVALLGIVYKFPTSW